MYKKNYWSVWITALSIILTSCASTKTISSKFINTTTVSDSSNFCNYYNSAGKVRYGFGNDDAMFYLKLEFVNESSFKNIINNGVTVYFDSLNKKDKDVFLTCPLRNEMQKPPMQGKANGNKPPQKKQGNDMTKPFDKNSSSMDLMMINPKAVYAAYDDSTFFDWKTETDPYKVNISKNNNNQLLTYEIWVPMSEFGTDSNGNFSLGIKCPVASSGSSTNNGSSGMSGGPGGGMSGGPGGGMGGPGGGMGGPGGGSMGAPPGGGGQSGPPSQSSSSSKSKTFWVSVHIN